MTKAVFTALCSAAVLAGLQAPGLTQVDETIKSGPEINAISQATTLLIANDAGGHGSGSLIAKDGDTCVGVTNAHVVVSNSGQDLQFVVRTADREFHAVTDIQVFRNEDLALVEFECKGDYQTIPLATYQLSPGQEVYLSGWPAESTPDGSYVRQFTSGSISTILDTPLNGYQVGYTNVTNSGMSGGQVLDQAGRLVAIHGLGAIEDPRRIAARLGVDESTAAGLADKTGFNYGIPVTTFLARASQAGFNYPFEVVFSTPQGAAPQGDYVYEPGSGDRVSYDNMLDNVNNTLDTINEGIGTVCRIFRC
ncbi:MAG: serine protease [Cyanobacteria bacterium P01_H01_bin.152]